MSGTFAIKDIFIKINYFLKPSLLLIQLYEEFTNAILKNISQREGNQFRNYQSDNFEIYRFRSNEVP